ncbi:unnamed protein product, partial [Polarella glacialis]
MFAAVAEALRARLPGAVAGEEARLAMAVGRALRAKLSSSSQPIALSLGTAVAVAEWCAVSSVPSAAASKAACDLLTSSRAQLLTNTQLRRVLSAALQAGVASEWVPVSRRLLAELQQKLPMQPAEPLLRLTLALLRAAKAPKGTAPKARSLSRWSSKSRRRAVARVGLRLSAAASLRRVAGQSVPALLARFAKLPALLSQVSSDALKDAAIAVQLLPAGSSSGGQVDASLPSALLPDAMPWVEPAEVTSFGEGREGREGSTTLLQGALLQRLRGGCLLGRCRCGYARVCHDFRLTLQRQAAFRCVGQHISPVDCYDGSRSACSHRQLRFG